ncbi:conserved Plasmodium protein, unknown function [Plasmodium berghei]|uniref:Uncharacterized protein n=2 Tax=Plasmodium berghei TaxID=5821 RepID=A0A509ARV1_PLABA|nr:conserved Plasmodium protein, unknown function [Plasmodium berghei ANKA]CXI93196.1 conserved Plasmodium protein, unknown function [Plasmodium berghei]SCL96773.1 conserved Plasmodium protein, unknown function [Plasmodium berghei]SCM16488.1 conserved Plasmodium protein, unknown function [Plasmodium berghei]SCM18282.1 conserved Plasmodium protein, unknown function [Plasmodium berghei]SCN27711.1 conserved Plasmodium protein, unknown function [Plasmodium berghei]|eukprot:XP_034423365.1 conserved Plasmodium protein, unknown function [Plasmodium berghei ANKA]
MNWNDEKNNEEKIGENNIDIPFDIEEVEIPINKIKNQNYDYKEKYNDINANLEKQKINKRKEYDKLSSSDNYLHNSFVKKEKQYDVIEPKNDEYASHFNKNGNWTNQENSQSDNANNNGYNANDNSKNNNNKKNNNSNDNNKERRNNNSDEEEIAIPIHRKKTSKRSEIFSDDFFINRFFQEEYDDDKLNVLDIFKYHDFPINLFRKKKRRESNVERKFYVNFVDTYNDEFIKKNINNNLIFESIGVCKGISFLHINNNINISCLGSNDNNAFYLYKMIPFNKIYTKDAIDKIMNNKNIHSKNENIKNQKEIKEIDKKKTMTNNNISNSTNEEENIFFKNYNMIKSYFLKKKEKKKLYNDLYLTPYEKNLKSSICIGTHIYSKERAVKKCFGLLIEQNVYSPDLAHEDNTNANKNLENLNFELPYYRSQIIFKPIQYHYKNMQIICNPFRKSFQNIPWEKFNNLKDVNFYYDIKNNVFNFSKDVYMTTKGAFMHFESPKNFVVQTANRVKDINIQMKKICEKSVYIAQDYAFKLSKIAKSRE